MLLQKMLKKLRDGGHRVLIFSQVCSREGLVRYPDKLLKEFFVLCDNFVLGTDGRAAASLCHSWAPQQSGG